MSITCIKRVGSTTILLTVLKHIPAWPAGMHSWSLLQHVQHWTEWFNENTKTV